jgi:hypothetical protein
MGRTMRRLRARLWGDRARRSRSPRPAARSPAKESLSAAIHVRRPRHRGPSPHPRLLSARRTRARVARGRPAPRSWRREGDRGHDRDRRSRSAARARASGDHRARPSHAAEQKAIPLQCARGGAWMGAGCSRTGPQSTRRCAVLDLAPGSSKIWDALPQRRRRQRAPPRAHTRCVRCATRWTRRARVADALTLCIPRSSDGQRPFGGKNLRFFPTLTLTLTLS